MKRRVVLATCLLAAGCTIGSDPSISTEELAARIEAGTAPLIVDARSESEYREAHVPGAVHVPFLDADERAGELGVEPGQTVVVYCAHGPRAAWARRSFAAAGIDGVVYLGGHMTAWLDEGRPVEGEAAPAAPEPALLETTWQWVEFRDQADGDEGRDLAVPDPSLYTLTLRPDGTAEIRADCNQLRWSHVRDGSRITFDATGPATLAHCGDASLDGELLRRLGDTASWVIREDRLHLNLRYDSGSLVFAAGG